MVPFYAYESTKKFSKEFLFGMIECLSTFDDTVLWITMKGAGKSWILTNSIEFYSAFAVFFKDGLFRELDDPEWLSIKELCYDNYFVLYGDVNYQVKTLLGENKQRRL